MNDTQYMRKYSVGRQVWRVIYPIIVYFLAQALAEGAAVFYVMFREMASYGLGFANVDPWVYMQQVLNSILQVTLPVLALSAAVSILIFLLYLRNDSLDRREWGIAKPRVSGGVIALSIVIGVAACVLGNLLISMSGLPEMSDTFIDTEAMLFSSNIYVELAVVGVLVPIAEELLNRALVFRRMRDYVSFVPAMLLSSLLFALMHGNIVQGLYAFGVGMLLAYVYERSGSLAASILLHISANVCSVFLTELPQVEDLLTDARGFFGAIAVSAAALVVCVLGIEAARRRRKG